MHTFITEEIKKQSVRALKKIINIPSVNSTENGIVAFPPFGKGIDQAIKETLDICEKMGMDTFYDPEGLYGFADFGEGDETVGVLCHLDVVPAGNESSWTSNPFQAEIRDNVLYGRGAQDDKGPTIAALYAFKAVMESQEEFKRKVRFIFGTDEETLWRCIREYRKHEELPDIGFVPDATFPVTYAEKGLLQGKLIGPGAQNLKIRCGDAPNVVPDEAIYKGTDCELLESTLEKLDIKFTSEDGQTIISGKSVHAGEAWEGINAINNLAKGLVGIQPHPAISFLAEKVGGETNGKSIFGEVKDDITGELSFNVAGLSIDEEQSEILLDLRIPIGFKHEEVIEVLNYVAGVYGLEFSQLDSLPALHVPKDSELVKTLMNVYQEKTGDYESEPQTRGGVTYARMIPNMVPFGAHFPGTANLAHQVDEGIELDDFYKAMEIYAESIYRLAVKNECQIKNKK